MSTRSDVGERQRRASRNESPTHMGRPDRGRERLSRRQGSPARYPMACSSASRARSLRSERDARQLPIQPSRQASYTRSSGRSFFTSGWPSITRSSTETVAPLEPSSAGRCSPMGTGLWSSSPSPGSCVGARAAMCGVRTGPRPAQRAPAHRVELPKGAASRISHARCPKERPERGALLSGASPEALPGSGRDLRARRAPGGRTRAGSGVGSRETGSRTRDPGRRHC